MIKALLILLVFSSYTQAHDEIFEGQYTYGNEVSIFKECNSEKVYWLQGSGLLISEVQQLALSAPKSYTPIYLSFRGHEHFEAVDGYQADYEHQLHLSEVKAYSASIPVGCK
jgi:hypothetical protein